MRTGSAAIIATDRTTASLSMRLTWSQHLHAARTIELAGHGESGTALALMGVALLMLLQDLSEAESGAAATMGD
mgnify:FL=1